MTQTRVLRTPTSVTPSFLSSVDSQTLVSEVASIVATYATSDTSAMSELASLATDRYALVPGSYYPDATTTGLLTSAGSLTEWAGSNIITTNTGPYENIKFTQNMDIRVGGLQFKNCWFAADPSNPLYGVRLENAGVNSQCYFESCLFRPTTATVAQNNIQGRNYYLRYCDISRGVDNCRMYYPTNLGAVALNIRVQQCYLHDLSWFAVDPQQSNTETHNDNMQLQGSDRTDWGEPPAYSATGNITPRNIFIFGNTIDSRYSTDTGDFGSLPDRGTGTTASGRYNYGDLCGIQITPASGHHTTGLDAWNNLIIGGYRGINMGSVTQQIPVGSFWRNVFTDDQGGRANLNPGGGWTLNTDATTLVATGDGWAGYSDTAYANKYKSDVATVGGQNITARHNQ
jgi:hypothetical protein